MKPKELSFKCILDTEEKRKALQEALFEVGVVWISARDKLLRQLKEPLYCIDQGEIATYDSADAYINSFIKELSYDEALAEIAKVEPEPKKKCIDFDIDDACCFYTSNDRRYSLDEVFKAIKENDELKAFGGIQYIEPSRGKKSCFRGVPPVCFYGGGFYDSVDPEEQDVLPVFPYKIRFWVEE